MLFRIACLPGPFQIRPGHQPPPPKTFETLEKDMFVKSIPLTIQDGRALFTRPFRVHSLSTTAHQTFASLTPLFNPVRIQGHPQCSIIDAMATKRYQHGSALINVVIEFNSKWTRDYGTEGWSSKHIFLISSRCWVAWFNFKSTLVSLYRPRLINPGYLKKLGFSNRLNIYPS